MTCQGFTKVLLRVINLLFLLVGLAIIGYGIYMVVEWKISSSSPPPPPPIPESANVTAFVSHPAFLPVQNFSTGGGSSALRLRRVLLHKYPVAEFTPLVSFWSRIPSAWFLFVFIGVGVVITLITCSGYIAASTGNGCCLSCYSIFIGLLMIIELGIAGFIFFYHDWQEIIPDDSTGQLDSIEDFIEDNIQILKWVALGIFILEAFALLLAVILRAIGRTSAKEYDSDDEYLAPRASRQPLLNKPAVVGASSSLGASAESRPGRSDAWSTRMREKYGLDTAEFSYNPSDPNRFSQQQPAVAEGKKSCCVIM